MIPAITKLLLEADILRLSCTEHGIKQIPVSWAEKNSRFTLEFGSTVLLWLKEDPISTVADNFGLTWDEVDGIMSRAVRRGLARREKPHRRISEYINIVVGFFDTNEPPRDCRRP